MPYHRNEQLRAYTDYGRAYKLTCLEDSEDLQKRLLFQLGVHLHYGPWL